MFTAGSGLALLVMAEVLTEMVLRYLVPQRHIYNAKRMDEVTKQEEVQFLSQSTLTLDSCSPHDNGFESKQAGETELSNTVFTFRHKVQECSDEEAKL